MNHVKIECSTGDTSIVRILTMKDHLDPLSSVFLDFLKIVKASDNGDFDFSCKISVVPESKDYETPTEDPGEFLTTLRAEDCNGDWE